MPELNLEHLLNLLGYNTIPPHRYPLVIGINRNGDLDIYEDNPPPDDEDVVVETFVTIVARIP